MIPVKKLFIYETLVAILAQVMILMYTKSSSGTNTEICKQKRGGEEVNNTK